MTTPWSVRTAVDSTPASADSPRAGTKDEVATQQMMYTYDQVERCLRYAFEYARKYGKKARGIGEKNTLALVGKSNVLTYMYELWNRVFAEVGADYPDVRARVLSCRRNMPLYGCLSRNV